MKRNNTLTDTRKNIRNNSGSQYNRKSKSAKKSKETIIKKVYIIKII